MSLTPLFTFALVICTVPFLDAKISFDRCKVQLVEHLDSPENCHKYSEEDKPTDTLKNCESAKKQDEDKKQDEEKALVEEPPKIGLLSLPASQQPGALYGFGGNIIDAGEVQLTFFADGYFGKKKTQTSTLASVLFGVTDTFSILFTAPYTPYNKDAQHHAQGLNDCSIQLEYAFYLKSNYKYVDQATLVGSLLFPTGSARKSPNTGFGAASIFIGATYYRSTIDWFLFTAPGALLTSSEHGTKFGDIFLYQFGFGQNIWSPPGWIYAWVVEIDGQYSRQNRIKGKIDKNSGGNSIFVTPSISISSKEMLLQFGVSLPITQNYFGKQHKFDYGFNGNFSWSFY